MTEPCRHRRLVDRHFERTIAPRDEIELRMHLGVCASCRERYERHLLRAQLDRAMPSAQDRLASALGLAPRRRARLPAGAMALLAAACAAVLAVSLRPAPLWSADPTPRGGAIVDRDPALYVYRITAGGAPRPVVDGVIGDRDELAFAYQNRASWSHLLVFAVDRTGRVYWYHPGWTDATTAPVAVRIDAGPERHELPEAITQPLPPGRIEIHAIFTDDAMDVRAIESGRRPARREELVVPLEVIDATGKERP